MPRSSNLTSLSYALELDLKELPGTPVWFGLEPNSYSSMGGQLSVISRTPIDPGRQNKKGTITDLDTEVAFALDFTKTNCRDLLQGFFVADARERAKTQPLNGVSVPITAVTATTFEASSGLLPFNVPGALVVAEGFRHPASNGLKLLSAATATVATTSGNVADASPPAGAKLTLVGIQFDTSDLSATYASNVLTFESAAGELPILLPGEWVYIGGDAPNTSFVTLARGAFRVLTSTADELVVDDSLLTNGAAPISDAGTGRTIQLFFGTVIRNEPLSADIKRRSYTLERQLGFNSTGALGMQAEYISGSVPNEFKLNIPGQDKVTADLSFVGCNNYFRSGEAGDEIETGTRIAALGEDAYNTTTDVSFTKLAIHTDGSQATPLFAYATDVSFTLNNNAKPSKAIGWLGAIDVNYGNFDVGGSIEAYFDNVDAVQAVRDNASVAYTIFTVCKGKNYGFLFDVPHLQLGNGQLNVEKDSDISIPLDVMGVQSKFGHTAMAVFFDYLPTAAENENS